MRALLLAGVIAVGWAGTVLPAAATPVLSILNGSVATAAQPFTAGFSFTTNQAVLVSALDAFDPSLSGVVRLYTASGVVLASATVTLSDSREGMGVQFYSHAITPVSLAANTTYYIAQDTPAGTSIYVDTTLATDPSITFDYGVIAGTMGATPTTDVTGGVYGKGFFGPNFDLVTAVPEPASLALLGVGVAGIAAVRRRRVA